MTKTALAPAAASTALAVPPGGDGPRGFIQLTTLAEALKFADILCATDLCPKDYRGKPQAAVIAMQMGMELGLPPLQAIQNISVINGRPSVWGDLIPAIVLSQPDCEDFREDKPEGEDPTKWVARCTIKRRGKSPFVQEFSWADAVRAKLAGKEGPWQQYPKRQLQMRARGFAARDAFPDRLKGLILAEEALDYPTPEKDVTPIKEPQAIVEKPAAEVDAERQAAKADQAAAADHVANVARAHGGNPTSATPLTITTGATILETAYIAATKDRKEHWSLTANVGEPRPATFLMAEESLYNEASSCAGSDHTFSLHWKLVRLADRGTAKRLYQIDLEEGGAQ